MQQSKAETEKGGNPLKSPRSNGQDADYAKSEVLPG